MNLLAEVKTKKHTDVLKQRQISDNQYLTFMLGQEMFAMNILNIREILEYGNLTNVPLMPVFVRGVINLRGTVVPVVDLTARFSGKPSEETNRTCIVIIEITVDNLCHVIGVVVDAVSAVLEIDDTNIAPPPAFGAKIRADFISGMGNVDGKFVIILNVNNVLSMDELSAVEQVAELQTMES